ncbi:MAG: HAD family phosphatase [Desulfuromonadales bacterium]|nr:HAD family phosphatase [Desulfuromonadales bacterium]
MVKFPGEVSVEAVIFDFDGVIVDTEPLHYAAFQRLLEPLGLGFSWEDYVAIYMGFDDRDAFVEAFKRSQNGLNPAQLQELIDAKAAVFQEVIRDGISAYPGVVSLIRSIREHHIPLAISSGALRSDITPILETLGITDCFDIIVTAEDVVKSKPDPESYTLAYARLNEFRSLDLLPEQVLAIEDTPAGISSAKGAGLRVIAVTNSYPATHLSGADYIVTTLDTAEIIFVDKAEG